jgi:hypothetical protein
MAKRIQRHAVFAVQIEGPDFEVQEQLTAERLRELLVEHPKYHVLGGAGPSEVHVHPWPPLPHRPWHHKHLLTCGTEYRGCAPDCPKDMYEQAQYWKGQFAKGTSYHNRELCVFLDNVQRLIETKVP